VSFIGSIPLGAINLTALQIYLQRDLKSVVYFSFATSAIEFVYSFFAIKGEGLISSNSSLDLFFNYISIVVLFVLGVTSLLSKSKVLSRKSLEEADNPNLPHPYIASLRKGFTLGLLNPLAIPFWIVMIGVLEKQNLIQTKSNFEVLSLMLGIGLGGWICVICFAFISGKIIQKKEFRLTVVNQIIGVIFLGLGIYQVYKLFK